MTVYSNITFSERYNFGLSYDTTFNSNDKEDRKKWHCQPNKVGDVSKMDFSTANRPKTYRDTLRRPIIMRTIHCRMVLPSPNALDDSGGRRGSSRSDKDGINTEGKWLG